MKKKSSASVRGSSGLCPFSPPYILLISPTHSSHTGTALSLPGGRSSIVCECMSIKEFSAVRIFSLFPHSYRWSLTEMCSPWSYKSIIPMLADSVSWSLGYRVGRQQDDPPCGYSPGWCSNYCILIHCYNGFGVNSLWTPATNINSTHRANLHNLGGAEQNRLLTAYLFYFLSEREYCG